VGFDIKVETEEFLGNEDRRWIGTRDGFNNCRSITLDASAFLAAHVNVKGAVPSGILLGKITATGLYAPYAGAASEAQLLTRTSTGGTVTLNIDGEVTAAVAASAAGFTAAAVQTAVDLLPNVDEEHTVTVSGSAGGPLTLTYGGLWAGENMPQVIVDNTSATGGTIVASTTTAGGAGVSSGLEVPEFFLFSTTKLGRSGDGLDLATAADVGVAGFWQGVVKKSKLPTFVGTNAGELDANAERIMGKFIRFEA
jgi:hypothetical protein